MIADAITIDTDDATDFKYSTLFLSVYSCWQKRLSQFLKKIPKLFFSVLQQTNQY